MDALSECHILLVEDQPEARALLRGMLIDIGVSEVYEADDGKAGLQMMQNSLNAINLIVCDWNMPSMSGLEFLREIRKAGMVTPFMMITGRGDSDSVIEAKKHGVNGFLRKPYTPEQVESKLRAMAQRIKAA